MPPLPPGPSRTYLEPNNSSPALTFPTLSLPSPIKPDKLAFWLKGYPPVLATDLIHGFTFGFDLGFVGSPSNSPVIKNHLSAIQHPLAVNSTILKEVKLGRLLGPFDSIPFQSFHLSPIGMVPKKNPGEFRMIVDLSSPQGHSINSGISDASARVSYASIDDAITKILECGPGAFLAKSDIESAFRLLPIRPSQYHLLGIAWDDKFFFDRCLPMGARSACQLFERFSSALHFIASRCGIKFIVHYLDDFLFISKSFVASNSDLNTFLKLCKDINVPLSCEKTVGPSQVLPFLGLEMDTSTETLSLPLDKLEKCRTWIRWMRERRKCQLKDMQALLGLLQFACAVIIPGRAFLSHMYRLTAGASKPYHYITLNTEAHKDLLLWLQFLEHHNGKSFYRTERFRFEPTCNIFTDACTSLGCGALFRNKWFSLAWPSPWYHQQSITLLELIPIVLAVECWGMLLRNQCLVIHTDHIALESIITNQSCKSKSPLIMALIRRLVLACLTFNILIKPTFIPGVRNISADALSRLQIAEFRVRQPDAETLPTPVHLPTYLS